MSEIEIHSRPLQAVEPDDVAFHALVRKYLEGCLADCQKRLETCQPDQLQNLQGQIQAFKTALAAPDKVLERQGQEASRLDLSDERRERASALGTAELRRRGIAL
jgi:hypothetical protein